MIGNFEEISLEGFQIVKSETFTHMPRKGEPSCSIWPNRLSFNKLSLQVLNNCEYVRMEVHPYEKKMLVIPVTSKDKDAIRWVKGQHELNIRYFESRRFGDDVYGAWGLDETLNYRAPGHLVTSNGKVMLMFDFAKAESWKTKEWKK